MKNNKNKMGKKFFTRIHIWTPFPFSSSDFLRKILLPWTSYSLSFSLTALAWQFSSCTYCLFLPKSTSISSYCHNQLMFWSLHFVLMSLLLFTLLTIDFLKLSAPLVFQDISYQITSFSLIHGLYFYSCPLWSSLCLADFYHTYPARALSIGHIFPVIYYLFVCLFHYES